MGTNQDRGEEAVLPEHEHGHKKATANARHARARERRAQSSPAGGRGGLRLAAFLPFLFFFHFEHCLLASSHAHTHTHTLSLSLSLLSSRPIRPILLTGRQQKGQYSRRLSRGGCRARLGEGQVASHKENGRRCPPLPSPRMQTHPLLLHDGLRARTTPDGVQVSLRWETAMIPRHGGGCVLGIAVSRTTAQKRKPRSACE
ncbi:uncharacterized protein LY79DRAFT_262246 [Colletotrichum navitas]|uniref:Uncharacterized protein n=1 Tax=Colletotrichum navitas TaxID=681940 RepID=A0AAD8PWU9_9PEZI|nr:uncharacterized protein LY79DRAFT_262246 [Colletotrichum navitas]KAK1585643.1 hypothetical protein LY79DRAFT_262246 [Colletotrichum navitas]